MNIIFFSHPHFTNHQSMPRFTRMLANGMRNRGHRIEIWSPAAKLFRLPVPHALKKWLGYIDQYILFPRQVRKRLQSIPEDALFVFTDQALGPWIPLTANRPHVIHCHDFLAQRSAMGEIPENPTSWTGKQYQNFIRRGYKKGRNFISVSQKTQEDLHSFLPNKNVTSEVIYNGLNNSFQPLDTKEARLVIGNKAGINLSEGYLLHVGGNQWYKNRIGVLEMYEAWRFTYSSAKLPLIMIGEAPSLVLTEMRNHSFFKNEIHFLTEVEDDYVRVAYAGASVFLFPSLAEGFGWPIAEAMASGCLVITTNEAPMTEVAGNAGFLIKRRPRNPVELKVWTKESAEVINQVLQLSSENYERSNKRGLANAIRFSTDKAINEIERFYMDIVARKENQ